MLKHQPGRQYKPHLMPKGKGASGKMGKQYVREKRNLEPVEREVRIHIDHPDTFESIEIITNINRA